VKAASTWETQKANVTSSYSSQEQGHFDDAAGGDQKSADPLAIGTERRHAGCSPIQHRRRGPKWAPRPSKSPAASLDDDMNIFIDLRFFFLNGEFQ
jgi:hypothetical protein